MATRSSSNKKTQKVQRIPGLTYGEQGELVAQQQAAPLPKVDGRSTNVQPPATNQIDQTRAVPMEEEVSVAMNAGGQPVTPTMPMGMGNILDLKNAPTSIVHRMRLGQAAISRIDLSGANPVLVTFNEEPG